MASAIQSSGYDSDQESIDLNELPSFGMENGESAKESSQSAGVGIAALLDAECAEKRTNERMDEIAKEMQLFTLDQDEGTKLSILDMEEKYAELRPPSVPFFTSDHHHIYMTDSLAWPFTDNKDAFSNLDPATIRRHIIEGYFEKGSLSKKKTKLFILYLFHLMSSTNDTSLMHSAFRTLTYIINANSVTGNIFNDVVLALANLGGDLETLGIDKLSLSSPVIDWHARDANPQEKPRGVFKENKILIMKFLNIHLSKSKSYKASELDILLKIYLAMGLDALLLDSGNSIHISNGITHILELYSSNQVFVERMLNLVRHIAHYCDFHQHTVAYVCLNYIPSTQKLGQILRSSLAYLQAEISLQRKKEDCIFEYVLVEDVLSLMKEQQNMFSGETDSSLLLWVLSLFDTCIRNGPLQSDQKAHLQELCNTLELTIKSRKGNIDDQHTLLLDAFTDRLMIKWRQKASHEKRQPTLMELQANFSPGSRSSQSAGLLAIQSNYSSVLE